MYKPITLRILFNLIKKMESCLKKSNTDYFSSQSQENQNQQTVQNFLAYDVLRMIFKYLSARDLYTVSNICRSWRDAANNEANTRRAPERIFKNFQVMNELDSKDSYNASHIGKDLRIKTRLGLICTKVQEENEWIAKGCFCENLPSNCSSVILGGYDIVVDDKKLENKIGLAVCTFLPEIPELRNKIYHADNHIFNGISETDINSYANRLLKQLLPLKNEKSKCIIILTNQDSYHFTKIIMKGLQRRYKPGTLSLWGGVCVDLKLCEASSSSRTCSKVACWTAITLSSPSLQSWSTVLLRLCCTEAQIEEKLNELKKKIQLKKFSLGLMFACCERLHKKEMEVKVFKRIFPQVPLIGLHGNGEYGLNTLNEKRENHLQHSLSTIFLILTYQ